MKKDMETRNKRLSVEKSIEFIERYKNNVFPLKSKHKNVMDQKGYGYFDNEVKDLKEFPFSNEEEFKRAYQKTIDTDVDNIFNELELFSSAFTSKLADEELAFQPLGKTFVRTVEQNYDTFCICRTTAPYVNTLELYILWKDRLKKIELEREINKLEQARKKIKETKLTPIGVEKM